MLDEIIPFRYLSPSLREAAAADLVEEIYEPDDVLIEAGDVEDTRVFLLKSGSVRMVDPRHPAGAVRVIVAGHYFGERAALFSEPRGMEVRALEPVHVLTMTGERFMSLVRESTPFSQALGSILRDKQGIFAQFERFRVELLRAVGNGSVDLRKLTYLYRRLEPALHPHVKSWDTLDVGALSYAVRRLPENVTRTLSFYLTDTLPRLYSEPDDRFTSVLTEGRRRAVYEMMPGKNMVLVRDGLSDLMDLITCLCLYAIEARKIRRRVRDRGSLDSIPADDVSVLEEVWPGEAEKRIRQIALHHEDFRIEVHKELNNYNSAHAESWSVQIADATRGLLGIDPGDLPDDFAVHVVSSNTHSIHNCLSPWITQNASEIVEWGHETGHVCVGEEWQNQNDLVCAVARDYLHANPEKREERAVAEAEAGILSLDWTAFTGIKVQLVDPTRVQWADTDPEIPNHAPSRPSLIVNIDYAFGEQAEHIIANLTSLFGRSLASVNVLGKAGGLVGERGEVLVATGFVEQERDNFHPVPTNGRKRNQGGAAVSTDLDRLRARLPDREVHEGNMLTVTGTLLQNTQMLHFNKHIWKCVGLEMEGAFYLRHLLQSMNRGAIRRDIPLRFLYYTSDLPLRHDSNLSARLRAAEGVPPLYAITREVLTGILET